MWILTNVEVSNNIVNCVLEVVFIYGSNQPPPRHSICGHDHEIPLRTKLTRMACSTCQSTIRLGLSVNIVEAPAEYLPGKCVSYLPPYP